MEINGYKNVKLVKTGVGEEDKTACFSMGEDTTNHIIDGAASDADKTELIEIKRLDSICENEKITILKIDVEGYEDKVIDGAEKLLSSEDLNVVIMETFGNKKLEQRIKDKGFSLYQYIPEERLLVKDEATSNNDNGIFIRDIKMAKERVKSAEKFKLGKRDI